MNRLYHKDKTEAYLAAKDKGVEYKQIGNNYYVGTELELLRIECGQLTKSFVKQVSAFNKLLDGDRFIETNTLLGSRVQGALTKIIETNNKVIETKKELLHTHNFYDCFPFRGMEFRRDYKMVELNVLLDELNISITLKAQVARYLGVERSTDIFLTDLHDLDLRVLSQLSGVGRKTMNHVAILQSCVVKGLFRDDYAHFDYEAILEEAKMMT